METQPLLKPSDVAQILNCSSSMVYKLAAADKIPSIRFSVSNEKARKKEVLRFYQKDIEIFVKDHYSIA
jgi:hypothetical protein